MKHLKIFILIGSRRILLISLAVSVFKLVRRYEKCRKFKK